MKILAIRIKNLASLEGETTIDFTSEPLAGAGIFAITGPTGAGKSTILDAICLALYDDTPRLQKSERGIGLRDTPGSSISQEDPRGILRDGTAEGLAEVDFVGIDQRRYRATWSVRRAYNKPDGTLRPSEITLKDITADKPIPGRKPEIQAEIIRLVGLNFHQFTRSIMLAQGDFTAFLKAGKDEKAQLLEKLTGTQIYTEISRRIFERHRDELSRFKELEIRKGEIMSLTTEEEAELKTQRQAFEDTVGAEQKEVDDLNRKISWYLQLTGLQTARDAAKIVQEKAINAQTDAASRDRYLHQIDNVQGIRPAVERAQKVGGQQANKQRLLNDQQESLEALTDKQTAAQQALTESESTLAVKIIEQEDALPNLDRAKGLDVELTEKEKQRQQSANDLAATSQRLNQLKARLTDRQEEANTNIGEISRLSLWVAQHESWRLVAENENLILSKLADATTLLSHKQGLTTSLKELQAESKQLNSTLEIQTLLVTSETDDLANATSELESQKKNLEVIPLENWEREKGRLDSSLIDLNEGLLQWRQLLAALQESDRLSKRLQFLESENSKRQSELEAAEGRLETAGVGKNKSRRMLEKAQLTASEGAETLRAHLVMGEPCPVCGSTEHPYTNTSPQVAHVLAELQDEVDNDELVYNQFLREQASLQEAVNQLSTSIASLKDECTYNAQKVNVEQESWKRFSLYEECLPIAQLERTDWIAYKISAAKTEQGWLVEKLQQAYQLQKQVEQLREHHHKLERQLQDTKALFKDTNRNIQSNAEKLENHQNGFNSTQTSLMTVEAEIAIYFPADGWFLGWKANSSEVEDEIRATVNQWKANLVAFGNHQRNVDTLSATIKGLQDQVEAAKGDKDRQETQHNQFHDQQENLNTQRSSLFQGKAVAIVERELKSAVDAARKATEDRRRKQEEFLRQITKIKTEKEQTETSIDELSQEAEILEQQIKGWLSSHNRSENHALTHQDLVGLLEFTQEWRDGERASLRAIDDAVMKAKTVMQERESAIAKHLEKGRPEHGVEQLESMLTGSKTRLQHATEQRSQIDFQLEQDAANKHKLGDLLTQLEAQAAHLESWAKLNEVIGAADGKKFRQIAQEYTLDVLLQFANIHLHRLSTRYILQRVDGTLGLQVIDRDMGNETRTVFSLSGGESFLVSLALALGLASLTSSRMRVESLFIDEGFGALDPKTLNIAMDALERLHQDGRKVGVISHVHEMTERIPVQIRVTKEYSGKSRIEVRNIL